MDIQQALLSKIIHDQSIALAVNARVSVEFFTDDKWRRVYERCLEHWRRFGTPPDFDTIHSAFPSYDFPVFSQSIDYFIDELRQRRKKVILISALNEAAGYTGIQDDPKALDTMEQLLRDALHQVRLETAPTFDTSFIESYVEMLLRLDERELDPGYLRGISTGVRGIDYVTGGLQPEQFVVIIGLPKSMKSSTLLHMAKAIHEQHKMPLFIGFEMSNEEQGDRLTSLYSEVSLTKIQNGMCSLKERRIIERVLKTRAEGTSVPFILSVDTESAMTVSGIQAKIMEYDPDVVLIDGGYLMQTELPKVEPGSPQALADIARGLKRLAQSQRIPIVVTTQADQGRSRRGLTAASAMYTQAWRQSADVMLGTEREDPEASDLGEVMVYFKVLASRSGPRAVTALSWNWGEGKVTEQPPDYFTHDNGDDT